MLLYFLRNPRRFPILEKAWVEPLGSESISRVIFTPRSPFPCGESISRKRSEDTRTLKKATAPSVPSNKVGRRSLRHSAKKMRTMLRIISVHLSFQRKFLQGLVVVEIVALAIFRHRKLIYLEFQPIRQGLQYEQRHHGYALYVQRFRTVR